MGQYYLLVNLDRKEKIGPSRKLGYLTKLAEIYFGLGTKPLLALALNSAASKLPGPLGTWAGDRIVVVGDYSDDIMDFLTPDEVQELQKLKETKEHGANFYDLADTFAEVAEDTDHWLLKVDEKLKKLEKAKTHQVFISLDSKEYLDPKEFDSSPKMSEFYKDEEGIMQALYACIFWSTGGGGGDIDDLQDGRWAGHHISLVELSEAKKLGCKNVSQEVWNLVDSVRDE